MKTMRFENSGVRMITMQDLTDLMGRHDEPSVSVYMPTYASPPRVGENDIRFRNLVREAVERLVSEKHMRPPDAHQLMRPAHDLLDQDQFWQICLSGVCVFVSKTFYRVWQVPLEFDQHIYISDHFHLKELLPLFMNDAVFYLLSLSQHHIRLYAGTRYQITEIKLGDVPTSKEEALKFHDIEKHLRFHTRTTGRGGHVQDTIFHGHGGESEDSKENMELFLQRVDRGLSRYMDKTAPLVLAGVDEVCAAYKKISHYPNIIAQDITGNPDRLRPEELYEKARRLIEPEFRRDMERYKESVQVLEHRQQATGDIRAILPKAYNGMVGVVFIPTHDHVWGDFDPSTSRVNISETKGLKDEDLSELAALYTLRHGGKVFEVSRDEMPILSGIAAIYRY